MLLPFSQQGKCWEPKALALRRVAGIGLNDLLDPWLLAPRVGLHVVEANAIFESLDDEHRQQLLGAGGRKWSGGVLPVKLPDGMRICILNPTHTRGRNKSTLMEEIAHVYLQHKPTTLLFDKNGLQVRDFNKAQEREAYGVGAAALLPWGTFFRQVNDGRTRIEIAAAYKVTDDLVKYRIQISGAFRLYRARQRAA